ncbi:hypothetical protein [Methanobrevibacter sp.]|uniref:hypothetical protein n=1 Tax=Methanobrevibacter sp. TaxID=66852 RepID=UPI00386369DC
MEKVPYYVYDDEKQHDMCEPAEPYIDDEDLREFLMEFVGDKACESDIQELINASSDESISEEDFDKLLDDFISKYKS